MYYDMRTDKLYDDYAMESVNNSPSNGEIVCNTEKDFINLLKNEIRKEIKLIKANKPLIDKIKKFCKESKYDFPKITCDYDDYSKYFLIFDGAQEVTEEFYKDIVYAIAKKLNSRYKKLLRKYRYKIDTGDGDEGCIYLEEV